jgi:voltage-gated potassium channel
VIRIFSTPWRWHVSVKELRAKPGWLVTVAAVRAVATMAVLLALYYLLPLDGGGADPSTFGKLLLGLVVFLGIMTWHVRLIGKSDNPALRALEGLFLGLPLFLLLFAAAYFTMSRSDAANFTSELSRTDSLYFTVTIFSTVGFGDISAKTESARLVVSAQMMLDLILLGVGVKVILGAVERSRDRLASHADDTASIGPS